MYSDGGLSRAYRVLRLMYIDGGYRAYIGHTGCGGSCIVMEGYMGHIGC